MINKIGKIGPIKNAEAKYIYFCVFQYWGPNLSIDRIMGGGVGAEGAQAIFKVIRWGPGSCRSPPQTTPPHPPPPALAPMILKTFLYKRSGS